MLDICTGTILHIGSIKKEKEDLSSYIWRHMLTEGRTYQVT
jgi:hypothetical protein